MNCNLKNRQLHNQLLLTHSHFFNLFSHNLYFSADKQGTTCLNESLQARSTLTKSVIVRKQDITRGCFTLSQNIFIVFTSHGLTWLVNEFMKVTQSVSAFCIWYVTYLQWFYFFFYMVHKCIYIVSYTRHILLKYFKSQEENRSHLLVLSCLWVARLLQQVNLNPTPSTYLHILTWIIYTQQTEVHCHKLSFLHRKAPWFYVVVFKVLSINKAQVSEIKVSKK